jgi:hypothetical protein
MSQLGKCMKCGNEKRLTRGYCSSACYPYLRRHGLLVRLPKTESPTTLSKIQEEVMVGSLLGDGCLFMNSSLHPYFSLARKLTDISYLEYEFSFFKDFCNRGIKIRETYDKRTQKSYMSCRFATRSSEAFSLLYSKWYQGKKIVPTDLQLTPLCCAIWFCDDGFIGVHKTTGRLRLKMSTHGFTKEENVRLCDLLENAVGGGHFSICKDEGNFFIHSSDEATKNFIKYIKNDMPECMHRKIKWTDEVFLQSKSYCHLKNRKILDLNDKSKNILSILMDLEDGGNISPKSIAEKMGWIASNSSTPSGLSLYLKRFVEYGWIEKSGIPRNKNNNTVYRLTKEGLNVCNSIGLTHSSVAPSPFHQDKKC